ncbi:glycoside hydrolase family 3 C-terminal domain-containing protein [Patescibacteria group bacterium]|nr:glycoside hydrolase family 3 C-terminal domain-containing protein [Patescibacteria group bacterium]
MSYLNPNKAISERVNELILQMTLEEKAAQLCCVWPLSLVGKDFPDENLMHKYMKNGLGRMTQFSNMVYRTDPTQVADCANKIQKFVKENTRLGIPILFQNEALSGFLSAKATTFPTPHNLSCTWEPELIEELAKVISKEMRSVGVHQALAPVLDITQDPRWGRVHETFGEDPYLASSMGVAFVKGLQGKDLSEGVIATGKHFVGYGASEGGLNLGTVHVNERELYEIYAKPFEAAIQMGNMQAVMAAYPDIFGMPAGMNKKVLKDLLRKKMGFDGHVLSEGDGVGTFLERYHVAKDPEEAAILALEGGLDADTPVTFYYHRIPDLIREGKLNVDLLNAAVARILSAKYQLGLFENPFVDEGKTIEVYSRDISNELSQKIAVDSIVLLKNENDLLPIKKNVKSIALIGPHADNLRLLFGNYTYPTGIEMLKAFVDLDSKQSNNEDTQGELGEYNRDTFKSLFSELYSKTTIEERIRESFPGIQTLKEVLEKTAQSSVKIKYTQGCELIGKSTEGFDKAIKVASESEIVILALGDKSGWIESTCGEGKDSSTLALPGVQQKLLEEIYALGKPIVLIIFNGRPFAINWASEHIPAILFVGFPGPKGAVAIAKVLTGEINPGGKLTMTVPRNVGQVPVYYYHKQGSGYKNFSTDPISDEIFFGGYIDSPRTPLYPFGHGISYTKFEFRDLKIEYHNVPIDGEVKVSCKVKNIGEILGDEVVQLYMHDREARVTRPVQELVGFKRITLEPKKSCKVIFTVKMSQLGFLNEFDDFVVEPGNIDVLVGNSSENILLTDSFEIIGETLELIGKRSYLANVHVIK